jgi:hypothetical protein
MEVVMDRNDQLYSDGLVKLRTLKALYENMKDLPRQEPVATAVQNDPPTREAGLLEKCRDRALAEYQEHQKRSEVFHLLCDRYRTLGLNGLADTYGDQARLENATTRGFQSVLKAYEKRLQDSQFHEVSRQVSKGDLKHAEQYLESYNHDRNALEEQTLRVLKVEETSKKLQSELTNRLPTHAEKEQLSEASHQRERFIRMAEYEASNTVLAYKGFQREIQAAERYYDALTKSNEPGLEKTGTEDRSSNPSRMNKLAMGVVVYQTLKVLDHEL